jgi:hypothetical protein
MLDQIKMTLQLMPSIPLSLIVVLLAVFPLAYIVHSISMKQARKRKGFFYALISFFLVFGVSFIHIGVCLVMIIDLLSEGERLEYAQAGATGILLFFTFIIPYLIVSSLFWIYLVLKARAINKSRIVATS